MSGAVIHFSLSMPESLELPEPVSPMDFTLLETFELFHKTSRPYLSRTCEAGGVMCPAPSTRVIGAVPPSFEEA